MLGESINYFDYYKTIKIVYSLGARRLIHTRSRLSGCIIKLGARREVGIIAPIGGIQTVGVAHKQSSLDTSNADCMELMLLARRLGQIKFDILSLYEILILCRLSAERRVMREDILILVLSITDRDESEARLTIEPLNSSDKTIAGHYIH